MNFKPSSQKNSKSSKLPNKAATSSLKGSSFSTDISNQTSSGIGSSCNNHSDDHSDDEEEQDLTSDQRLKHAKRSVVKKSIAVNRNSHLSSGGLSAASRRTFDRIVERSETDRRTSPTMVQTVGGAAKITRTLTN